MNHVPYRGAGPAMQDLISGHVHAMFDGLGSSANQIQGGTLRRAGGRGAAALARVPRCADRRRGRAQGLRGVDLVCAVRSQGHTRPRSSSG